jgi:hypothetical protein
VPDKPRYSLPITFPGLQEPLRTQLERFAREVDREFEGLRNPDLRPQSAHDAPLGAQGVYYVDAGTRAMDRELPNLGADDAGARLTFIRRQVGTAVVRALAPATIAGQPLAFLPPRLGAYELVWDGVSWYLVDPVPAEKHEWSADQLKGGPFSGALGVSGTATLIPDPIATGVTVRGFGSQGHDAVRREFLVPTGIQGSLLLRTYFRAQSGPTGSAVVHRRLHARQFVHGTGIPSGYATYTLPSVTMPSGSTNWRYQEDRVPLNQLGLSQGRVEVVFSRPSATPYASPDLASMLLVESLTIEVEP